MAFRSIPSKTLGRLTAGQVREKAVMHGSAVRNTVVIKDEVT